MSGGAAPTEAPGTGARAPLLSVIVPAYNERETIAAAVERVLSLPLPLEVIVVDDASTDGTAAIVATIPGVILLRHETNQGKGAAIRTALSRSAGAVVAIQDADLEYDPAELPRLMEPILKGEVRVVYGSRFLRGRPQMAWPNYLCNRILAVAANALYGAGLTDEATCYKLFHGPLIRSLPLTCRRFEFCPEVTARVRKRGERILELPISYHPRSYDSGKKIRWWDGVEALWTLLKYRFRE